VQSTDVNRAKQLLDDAGWKPGADGVRAKDANRLAFTLLSYPGRADLTPYAVSIQSQVKPLGVAVDVKEVQNIGDATKGANFDAAMKSNNMLPTANPLYEYNRLIGKGGGDNAGNYVSQQVEDLLTQMRVELDPAKSAALSRQVQEIVKTDVPVVFLTATPITAALRKSKVRGYVPHPNDSYLITTDMSVS
jgi:peptide/nickel transport system substrate-binding protein